MAWATIAYSGLTLFALGAVGFDELRARLNRSRPASDRLGAGDAFILIGLGGSAAVGGWGAIQNVLT